MELPPPPPPPRRRRMKDKQKRKKERTWAEAARLVRRAARGAAAGGLGGGLPRGSRGGGGARPCPPQQGAGPPGCGASDVPGPRAVAPFSAHPTEFLRRGELANGSSPPSAWASASPPPRRQRQGVPGNAVYSFAGVRFPGMVGSASLTTSWAVEWVTEHRGGGNAPLVSRT